jgi:hypothetical protein
MSADLVLLYFSNVSGIYESMKCDLVLFRCWRGALAGDVKKTG